MSRGKQSGEPTSLSVKILKRFLEENTLKLLIEKYKSSRKSLKKVPPPLPIVSPEDKKIFADYKKGFSVIDLVKKYRKTYYSIILAITRAAR